MSELRPTVRFESSDINTRAVILTGICVLLSVVAIIFLLHFLFSFMVHEKAESTPPASPSAARISQYPPEPRLQAQPRLDYEIMRSDADWHLTHYQWIDRQKGVIQIPIDRAIDLIAQRGIPPSSEPASKFYRPEEGDRLTGFEEREEPHK